MILCAGEEGRCYGQSELRTHAHTHPPANTHSRRNEADDGHADVAARVAVVGRSSVDHLTGSGGGGERGRGENRGAQRSPDFAGEWIRRKRASGGSATIERAPPHLRRRGHVDDLRAGERRRASGCSRRAPATVRKARAPRAPAASLASPAAAAPHTARPQAARTAHRAAAPARKLAAAAAS